MPTLLFMVDDVFSLSNGYVIPTPGIPVSVRGIRIGLPIELRRPDGTVLQTTVASVQFIDPYDPERPTQIALLGIPKADIPIGTEIWAIDDTLLA